MLCTAIRYGRFSYPDDVNVLLDNAAWAIHSTYHTVLKASPGAAIFGHNMLFDIPQSLTNCGNQRENAKRIDYDYKVRDKILLINVLKAESTYRKDPWTITAVHTNGTIRIQRRTRSERLSIQRVQPFTDNIL
jgi:hypothetical protein